MTKRVQIPFIGPLDTSGDQTTFRSSLASSKNSFLDVNSDNTAIIKLRPTVNGEVFDLSTDMGTLGLSGFVAWDQVFDAKPSSSSDGANGWFLAYSENQNGDIGDIWCLNAPAETTAGFNNYYDAYYGDIASGGGEGMQALSTAFYYDRTYSDGDLAFVTAGKDIYLINWDGTSTPPTFQTWNSVLTTGNVSGDMLSVAPFRGHIIFTDGDLLYWSDLNDYKSVPAINVAGPDLMNDRVISLATYRNELLVGGSRSIEFWQLTGASGASAIAPTVSATLSMGIAPLSNLFVWQDAVYFVNNKFQVARLQNREVQILSDPIANDISPSTFQVNQIYKVGCAYVGDTEFLFVRITTSLSGGGKTFVMNIKNGTWSEWTITQGQGNGADGFPIPATSANMGATIGANETDTTKADRLFMPSLWSGGHDSIPFEVITAFNDHGSMSHKRSIRLLFHLKSGEISNLTLEYRDSETDSWKTLGDNVSTIGHIAEFIALGRYRSRQYRLTSSATSDISIGMAEEEIEMQEF